MYHVILMFSLLLSPLYSNACSWSGDPTGGIPYEKRLKGYIQEAEVIFVGKIVEYEWKVHESNPYKSKWHYHKIEVTHAYKGNASKVIVYWPDTSCHEIFPNIGEDFLFFGNFNEKREIQFPMVFGTLGLELATKKGVIKKLEKHFKKQL